MRSLRERGHLPELEDALRNDRVGLHDVVATAPDQQPELVEPLVALTAGDCERVELIAEAAQSIVVMPVERLLEPENVELLELARDSERPTKIPPLMPGPLWA